MTDTIVVRWDMGTHVAVIPTGSAAPTSFVDDQSGARWWGDGDGWERRRAARHKYGEIRDEYVMGRALKQPVHTGRKRAA